MGMVFCRAALRRGCCPGRCRWEGGRTDRRMGEWMAGHLDTPEQDARLAGRDVCSVLLFLPCGSPVPSSCRGPAPHSPVALALPSALSLGQRGTERAARGKPQPGWQQDGSCLCFAGPAEDARRPVLRRCLCSLLPVACSPAREARPASCSPVTSPRVPLACRGQPGGARGFTWALLRGS